MLASSPRAAYSELTEAMVEFFLDLSVFGTLLPTHKVVQIRRKLRFTVSRDLNLSLDRIRRGKLTKLPIISRRTI